jgi:subtilisin family serine protease
MKSLAFVVVALVVLVLASIPTVEVQSQSGPEYVTGQVIVKLGDSVPASDAAALASSVGAAVERRFQSIGAQLWRVEGMSVTDAVAMLRSDARVDYAEPNYIVHALQVTPDDPRFGELWGLHNTGQTGGTPDADIDAPEAWSIETGEEVLVGIIDTGVDYTHPDLAANVWTNPGEIAGNGIDDDGNGYTDDIHGWDFINNDSDPMDDNSHGTHCSGTIAAVGDNATGVVGVSWSARIMALKFLGASGSGSTADAITAVEYATMMGARLTSNSWGGGGFSQALMDAIEAAGDAGILFVAAAGNSGLDADVSPHYPAGYDLDNIVSVANTTHTDGLNPSSTYGLVTVDLGAPGTAILSTTPGASYGLKTGTSMATPHVSGAISLLWSAAPLLSHMDVKDRLLASVDPIPALAGKTVTGGRLNVAGMLSGLDSIPPDPVVDLAVVSTGSNTATLSWTATGDDSTDGTAKHYDVRYSVLPIDAGNFDAADEAAGEPAPKPAGQGETFTVKGLDFTTTYYFALRVLDEQSNASPVSNTTSGTTLGIPALTYAPGSFSDTLLTGGTSTHHLTIGNVAEGTLDFEFALLPPWLRADPASGRVLAGEIADVDVIFDATGLHTGTYTATVILATNDPAQPAAPIAVSLRASAAPDIAVDSGSLDYGDALVGVTELDTVMVTNIGTQFLNVAGASVDAPEFSVDGAGFLLGLGESRPVVVSFSPAAVGAVAATLTITSDDPDQPMVTVVLAGNGVEPAAIAVTPLSLSQSLLTGAAATETMTIENHGGVDLEFAITAAQVEAAAQVSARRAARAALVPVAGAFPRGTAPPSIGPAPADAGADAGAAAFSMAAVGLAGGSAFTIVSADAWFASRFDLSNPEVLPDVGPADRYTWAGDFALGDNAFAYVIDEDNRFVRVDTLDGQQTVLGTLTPFGSETWTGMAVDPTTGEMYATSCNVVTSSLYRIDVDAVTATRIGAVGFAGIIAVAVDDQGDMYAHDIVSDQLVSVDTGTGQGTAVGSLGFDANFGQGMAFDPVSGELYLSAFNNAAFRGELRIADRATGATALVGALGATSPGGLVQLGWMAVPTSGVPWLRAQPVRGVVPPGGAVAVDVTFDATGLEGGSYDAGLSISSNDLDDAEVAVAAHLDVTAAPDISVSVTAIDFGAVFVGDAPAMTLTLENTGVLPLSVSGVAADNAEYGDDAAAFVLAPDETRIVHVTFTPAGVGPSPGTLTIASNDPDEPSLTVALAGAGVEPPVIAVSPGSLTESLWTGGVSTRVVSVGNTGGSDLEFTIAAEDAAAVAMILARAPGFRVDPVASAGADSRAPAAAVAVTPSLSSAADPAVLVIQNATAWGLDMSAFLSTEFGVSATVINSSQIAATNFSGYDLIITTGSQSSSYYTALSANVAKFEAFVAAGGVVQYQLATQGDDVSVVGGVQVVFGSLSDINLNVLPSHPIMTGLPLLLEGNSANHCHMTGLPAAAKVLTTTDAGSFPTTAEYRFGAGTVVVTGMTWEYLWLNGYNSGPMLYNAVAYSLAGAGLWVSLEPQAGVVGPGQSLDVMVMFDASGLSGGGYDAELEITSNDPAAETVAVPVHMDVTSGADIGVSPVEIEFGGVFVGAERTETVEVTNSGVLPLAVASLSTDHGDYTADATPFVLNPGEARGVAVTYTPSSSGPSEATLSIGSDDPDEPTVTAALSGAGVAPPVIVVSPESLSETLHTGAMSSRVLTIDNTAGGSDLTWGTRVAGVTAAASQPYTLTPPVPGGVTADGGEAAMDGRTTPITAVLDDLTGVRILHDVAHGQFGAALWTTIIADVESRGADVVVSNQTITPALLADFDVVWSTDVSTQFSAAERNALASWLSTGHGLILEGDNFSTVPIYNAILSSAGAGITYTATSGTSGTTTNIYPHETTEGVTGILLSANIAYLSAVVAPAHRLIDDVAHVTNSAYSEVGLGRIVAMADEVFENNRMGSAGNQLFANQVFDWVAGGVSWMSLSPQNGTVPAGESDDVAVEFDATGLEGGGYDADLTVASNDPASGEVTIPVHLDVSAAPDIDLSTLSLDFGVVFAGIASVETVTVSNAGVTPLSVSGVSTDNADYTVAGGAFVVSPGGSHPLEVTFQRGSPGSSTGELSIMSSDPDEPAVTVSLTAQAVAAPQVSVAPSLLSASLPTGGVTTQPLTITNTGGGTLAFGAAPWEPTSGSVGAAGKDRRSRGEGVVAQTTPTASYESPPGEPITPSASGPTADAVLVIQNTSAWGLSMSGFLSSVFGITPTVINSSQIATTDFSPFDLIITTGDQSSTYYSALTANVTKFANFVAAGGRVQYQLATQGSNVGVVGGVTVVFGNADDYNKNVMPFHPIMEGLPPLLQGAAANHCYLTDLPPAAEILTTTQLGRPTTAVYRYGTGQVVVTGMTWEYLYLYGYNPGPMMGNSIEYLLMGTRWLSVDPEAGELGPGESAIITVTFDARGLEGGAYDAIVLVTSNDPVTPQSGAQAHLDVTAAPDIALSVDTIDFGAVFVGGAPMETVTVSNDGVHTLVVTAVTTDHADFTVSPSPFVLDPGAEHVLEVTYAPAAPGAAQGMLAITSNDPDESPATVSLGGEALVPPVMSVVPSSLLDSLYTDERGLHLVTIGNDGGSDLEFTISIENASGPAERAHAVVIGRSAADVASIADERQGEYERLVAGGLYSHPAENAAGEYATGAPLRLESVAPLSQVSVLYFSDLNTLSERAGEQALINLGVTYVAYIDDYSGFVTQLTASEWDVVVFESAANVWDINPLVAYADGGGKLITSYWEYNPALAAGMEAAYVGSYFSPLTVSKWQPHAVFASPNQVPDLSPVSDNWNDNGDRFQPAGDAVALAGYTPDPVANEAAIVLGNDDRTILNGFLFTDYLSRDNDGDGKADVVELVENEVMFLTDTWLVVRPSEAVVTPTVQYNVQATFDATDLPGGDYAADVVITSNDPANGEVVVPASLHVTGVPDIVVTGGPLEFGQVVVGAVGKDSVSVYNDGTETLVVDEVSVDAPDFSVDPPAFSLGIGETKMLVVTFSPANAGRLTSRVTLWSNDPDEAAVAVGMSGEGVPPPDMVVTPDALSDHLFTGGSVVHHVKIDNGAGEGNLEWEIAARNVAMGGVDRSEKRRAQAEAAPSDHSARYDAFAAAPPDPDARAAVSSATEAAVVAFHTAMAASVADGEVLFFDDMESGINGWSHYATNYGLDQWQQSIARASSSSHSWRVTQHEVEGSDALETPVIDLSDSEGASLVFMQWYNFDDCDDPSFESDGGIVEVSVDGGATWQQIYPVDGYPYTLDDICYNPLAYRDAYCHDGGVGAAFIPAVFDLTPFVGGPVSIRFRAGWDCGNCASNEGWYIDDVTVYAQGVGWLTASPASGTLAPGAHQVVDVTFDAAGLNGGAYAADLVVSSNDPDNAEAVVTVALDVTGAPDISVSAAAIDFGEVYIGVEGTNALTITNAGTDLLAVTGVTIDGADYSVDGTPFQLNPGESRGLDVGFAPSTPGASAATLTIACNDPDEASVAVSLSGVGVDPPVMVVSPDSIQDDLLTGETSAHALTVANNGGSDLVWSVQIDAAAVVAGDSTTAAAPWIDVSPLGGTLPPGGSAVLAVVFDAAGLTGGEYVADILVSGNDPFHAVADVTVHLVVTGAPDIAVSDSALAFSAIFVGATQNKSLTVYNVGTDVLAVTDIAPSNANFSVDTPSFNVGVGGNRVVHVTFAPSAPGPHTGTLTITSNDADETAVQIAVSGQGIDPPVMAVAPDSLHENLTGGQTSTQTLTIDNTAGGSNLIWSIQLAGAAAASQSYTLGVPRTGAVDPDGGEMPLGAARSTAITAPLEDLTGVRVMYDRSHGQFASSGWSTIIADLTSRGAVVAENFSTLTPGLLSTYHIFWSIDLRSDFTAPEVAALTAWGLGGGGIVFEGDDGASMPSYNAVLNSLGAGIVCVNVPGAAGVTGNIHPHATTSGVATIFLSGNVAHLSTVAAPAGRLIDDVAGVPNTAYSEVGLGRVVVMADELLHDTRVGLQDGQLFANQLFDWVEVGGAWLSVSPASGVIAAGNSVGVTVTFDSHDVDAGEYRTGLLITSNDPVTGAMTVPVTLSVGGSALTTGVAGGRDIPERFALHDNYPNPFNPVTTIRYDLPHPSNVRLDVFNVRGERVATLVDGRRPEGRHAVEWNGRASSGQSVAAGVYFYRLRAGEFMETRKMVLVK